LTLPQTENPSMKLRLLSILLIAAALAASPAAGQTIKSLGFNTTNGSIVYSGTNDLRFPATIRIGTNQSGFSSGGQFLTLTDGAGGVAMIIGTNAITLYDPIAFSSTGNAATTRTNLGLGATNNVTFSNITASGTLAVTGNVTMSGTANIAPSQTASSGSSLMTRTLTDNNPLWTAGSIRLLAAYASDSANGGAVTLNSYGLGSATVSGGTNTNGYGRANLADGINTARQYLGGGVNFTQNISASFVATIRSQLVGDSVIRFVVGAPAGGVPPPAQSNAITIRGFGVEFSPGAGPAAFDGTTNARARLFAHNGTNYSTSAYTADFPAFFINSQSQAQFIVSSSTNGLVTLHMSATDSSTGIKSAGRPSTTPVLTLSNGPTDGAGGPFVSLFSVNSSTNAPASRPEMVIYNGFIEVKN
jgi:hypothetical protein